MIDHFVLGEALGAIGNAEAIGVLEQYSTDPSVEVGIGAFGCVQTNTALPQLCNISWVSAETSQRKAQCIFALICTAKNIISKHRKI